MSQHKIKSEHWYLENVQTKNISFLNEGRFGIGRKGTNDLIIDGQYERYCSRNHCIISLNNDYVRLFNRSRFGTYVNDRLVNDRQLYNGDIISLLNRDEIPEPYDNQTYRDYDSLSFILRRLQSVEPDDGGNRGQGVVSTNSCGEILVSTQTVSIDLTNSDDEEDYQDKFADDYEIGEPSSKNIGDSSPQRPELQRPNDPVTKALDELNKKIAAQKAKREAQKLNVSDTPMNIQKTNTPIKRNEDDAVAKPNVAAEEKKPTSSPYLPLMPFKNKHRIAHVPKDARIMPPSPNVQPPSPPNAQQKRGTKRGSCSPPDNAQSKRANVIIDSILTPPSWPGSPAQPIVVPENHAAALIRTIVGWNATNLMNKINANFPPKHQVAAVPAKNFIDFNDFERVQTSVLKCNLWHRLHRHLQPLQGDHCLRILDPKTISVSGHQDRLIYSCEAPCNLNLQYGVVLVVKATVSSGSASRQFLGFINNVPQQNGNMCAFELEVVMGMTDSLRANSKAIIIAYLCIDFYVKLYETIYEAQKSNLFEAVVNPTKLRPFTTQNRLDRTKCILPQLDASQYDALEKIYNNTVDALQRGNASAMAINGGPGSGKSHLLLEAINALARLDSTNQKKFKILVTGNSEDTVDSLARKLHYIRTTYPNIPIDLSQNLNFVRYGNVANVYYQSVKEYQASECAKLPNGTVDQRKYQHILRTANIVFAPVGLLHGLSRHCNKFDVILFDNASEVNEITSTLPFILSPSSFVMFGDRFRTPTDSMDLAGKYRDYNLTQSMFGRFVNAGKCVLNLRYTYRFSPSVLHLLNQVFYNQTLNNRALYNTKVEYKGFGVFHHYNDSFMLKLIERFMEFAPPKKCNYAIVLPPNIQRAYLDKPLGQNKPYVMLSQNINFTIEEKDVVIIWVNESSKNEPRYRLANLLNVMTRAKNACFFIGCSATFNHNQNWKEINDYAKRCQAAFDLNKVKDISVEDIKKCMRN
ncbi:uncharacterized protein LOC129578382 isoform X1 [Sitodiplosis mosellana]|uniref:uncharacterized protein LOC129578382 isoform X1 n=1 Tax=Sitodiplosis mosellana TaxID=263140 RepID=UPI002444136F|nr:uncharacterized protein LOC129578382 isoform X1 [Sitodiplosis mosellana]XP_055322840.1 uncharacterized protein LOC129578382 isoform X1 [Sitodiplosis mosellana]XP_055322841.1 uncharacterized protein LOC129578382 isoform X1 [Sitodiplosis mosellana]